MKKIELYTDGACSGNPGPGGFGTILLYGEHKKTISEGYRKTTNNRMEILAVISGLEALKERCEVTVFSDSKYVVDAVNKGWAQSWRAKGWKRGKNKAALNPDLWERLLELCEKHLVKFVWVKGHAGHPMNELADKIAVEASQKSDLKIDIIYENSPIDNQSEDFWGFDF